MAVELPPQWSYAFGGPPMSGVLRHKPEDFIVEESLPFELDGEGEHLYLQIRKRNLNTEWVGRQLAKLAGVRKVDVGYAGLKDRNAVTTQWFSIGLAGREAPDWSTLESEDLQILQTVAHGRKLRRGALRCNRFTLRVRRVEGDPAALEQRLATIAARGMPNYFGLQRFGRDFGNLVRVDRLFSGALKERDRHKRGLYLSAARSYLFNNVLSRRVDADSWDRALDGDVMVLDGSHAYFLAEQVDEELLRRLDEGDIHPSGPLWGRGEALTRDGAAELERVALVGMERWQQGLEAAGMKQERRALRCRLQRLDWHLDGDELTLSFGLPAGSYATAVLREVVEL